MYCVTYRNVLRDGMRLSDFRKWVRTFWEVQQAWGAQTVTFWTEKEGPRRLLFCQYLVDDVGRWNRRAIRASSTDVVRELERIVETNRITVQRVFTFGRPPHPN
jgi:hypothetical protein